MEALLTFCQWPAEDDMVQCDMGRLQQNENGRCADPEELKLRGETEIIIGLGGLWRLLREPQLDRILCGFDGFFERKVG